MQPGRRWALRSARSRSRHHCVGSFICGYIVPLCLVCWLWHVLRSIQVKSVVTRPKTLRRRWRTAPCLNSLWRVASETFAPCIGRFDHLELVGICPVNIHQQFGLTVACSAYHNLRHDYCVGYDHLLGHCRATVRLSRTGQRLINQSYVISFGCQSNLLGRTRMLAQVCQSHDDLIPIWAYLEQYPMNATLRIIALHQSG